VIRRALLVSAAASLVAATPAQGHAILERTQPERGAALEAAPAQVAFFFNEPVEASFGAVRVFDARGDAIDTGPLERPDERSEAVAVSLPDDLPDGGYTTTYRVISADSHPVSGGFTFTVGHTGASSPRTVSELLEGGDAGRVTSVSFWAARWLGYLAMGLATGLLGFLLLVWRPAARRLPDAAEGPRWREARAAFAGRWRALALGCGAVGLAASLASIGLQGATAAGTSFWSALGPDVVGEVMETRFGAFAAVRTGAWAAFTLAAWRPRPALAALALVPILLAPALAGHSATQDPEWLLVPSDVVHVLAMGLWFGGLVTLVAVIPSATRRLDPADRSRLLAACLVRFSPVALICVVMLVSTGAAQSILYLTSLGELFDTAFGRAITIKIALFATVVAIAAVNRHRLLPSLERLAAGSEAPGATGNALRRAIRAEVALVAATIGVAAALVSYAPPTDAQGIASGSTTIGDATLEYTVDPALAGRNRLHLYLFDAATGAQYRDARDVEASLELADKGIGPLEADLRRAGPGHYTAPDAPFGVAGEWTVEVAVRTSRFDQDETSFQVPIG
jgi:copper transport protein